MLGDQENSLAKEIFFIEYPKEGLWLPGYVTNRAGEILVLYVPTSPNPTSGFTIVVHQSKVVPSKMKMEAVTSFIVGVDCWNIRMTSYNLQALGKQKTLTSK